MAGSLSATMQWFENLALENWAQTYASKLNLQALRTDPSYGRKLFVQYTCTRQGAPHALEVAGIKAIARCERQGEHSSQIKPPLRLRRRRRRRTGPIQTIRPTGAYISTAPAIAIIAIRKGANAAAHFIHWRRPPKRPTATAVDARAVVCCRTIGAAGAAIVFSGL